MVLEYEITPLCQNKVIRFSLLRSIISIRSYEIDLTQKEDRFTEEVRIPVSSLENIFFFSSNSFVMQVLCLSKRACILCCIILDNLLLRSFTNGFFFAVCTKQFINDSPRKRLPRKGNEGLRLWMNSNVFGDPSLESKCQKFKVYYEYYFQKCLFSMLGKFSEKI